MTPAVSVDARRGLATAAIGYLVGVVLTAVAGAIVITGGGYDPNAQTGVGSDVGRTVMQLRSRLPLEREVMPLAALAALQIPLWVGLGGAPLAYARRAGRSLREQFHVTFRPRDLLAVLGGVGMQLIAVPLIYLVIFWLIESQDVSAQARALTDRAHDPFGVVLLVVVVAVGAPWFEELFFRGLLLPALAARFGNIVGVLGSALLFGAIHLQPLQFPALFAFGLFAGWLRVATGRLVPCMLAHVGFNAVTLVVLLSGAGT